MCGFAVQINSIPFCEKGKRRTNSFSQLNESLKTFAYDYNDLALLILGHCDNTLETT